MFSNISIPSGATGYVDLSATLSPAPSLLYVVGFVIGGSADVVVTQIYISSDNKLHARLRNLGNGSLNNISLNVLYV